jgi:hypothetical protein
MRFHANNLGEKKWQSELIVAQATTIQV